MEESKVIQSVVGGGPRGRGFLNRHRNILVGLCLVSSAFATAGCAVAPALMVASAAVSAVAVATEGERLILNLSEPRTVVVKNETGVYAGPGEGYCRKGTLVEGDKIEVLGQQGGWVQCRSDQFETGWIQAEVN